ncbi:MAG: DEAD/DEAH box helicase, partial [Clostridia bacterium]|nr:DEAD/DEAH box helicase [Clostridia bacterium]
MTERELRNKSIRFVKGVGEKRAQLFEKLGVSDADALLRFYPRAYEDWSNPDEIFFAPLDTECCVKARVETEVRERKIRRNLVIYYFRVGDESGYMNVTLFNNKYLAEKIQKGREYLFYGKIIGSHAGREMSSPAIKPVGSNRIRPIYKATEGLTSAMIEGVLLKNINELLPDEDIIPESVRAKNDLCTLRYALKNIHFPESPTALDYARKRLIFEELFVLQSGMRMVSASRRVLGAKKIEDCSAEYQSLLPFSLTGAQRRVIEECAKDMMGATAMSRLVQGDVGSGKTAVAAALMYSVAKSGYMSAMMAPTTILATQHYNTLKKLFEGTGLKIELLIGSTTKAERARICDALAENGVDIIVGTHALLTEDVKFE